MSEQRLRQVRTIRTLRKQKAELERQVAEKARAGPRRWATPGAMAAELDPRTHRTTAALDLIDRYLVKVADNQLDRLMVFCPPQEGKSQKISRRTPAWLLTHDPTLRIAIVSYAANKAERWGRQIRRDILAHPELGITLRADSRAAGRWETEQGGGLICVGIDGGITGEPVDILVIDDPVRGRAEAESSTYRDTAWGWWESNGATRLSSRGRVILMMTRWHEDDLAGRLLAREPGRWTVLRIPAIAEDGDPLGRRPGDELVSVQGREPGYFRALEVLRTPYVFLSIYQQTPTAAEGLIFKKLWWRYWSPAPSRGQEDRIELGGRAVDLRDSWRFMTGDLAASTKTSADWTVAAAWALAISGDLVLLDYIRARVGEAHHFALFRPLAERWRVDTIFLEASQYGTTLVAEATRSGLHITPIQADVDKLTRALPYSERVSGGRVWLPAGARDKTTAWVDEHAGFPNATHDDMVDNGSLATRVAVTKWVPPPPTPVNRPARASDDVDFLTVPM